MNSYKQKENTGSGFGTGPGNGNGNSHVLNSANSIVYVQMCFTVHVQLRMRKEVNQSETFGSFFQSILLSSLPIQPKVSKKSQTANIKDVTLTVPLNTRAPALCPLPEM